MSLCALGYPGDVIFGNSRHLALGEVFLPLTSLLLALSRYLSERFDLGILHLDTKRHVRMATVRDQRVILHTELPARLRCIGCRSSVSTRPSSTA